MKPSEVIREKANMSSMASFKPIPETWDWIMAICSYLDEQAETTLSEGTYVHDCKKIGCRPLEDHGMSSAEKQSKEIIKALDENSEALRVLKEEVLASQKETHLKPTVQSFIKFCEAHPDYRLFQALQAWLKENGQHIEYIYLQKPHGPLEDAFYLDDIQ